MKDLINIIKNQIRSAWRYRWYAMIAAWLIAIVGWAAVFVMPDKFESNARVFVDTETVLRPLLKGLAVQTNLAQRLQLMTRTLLSRKNLEKVMRETDMDHDATTVAEKERLLEKLKSEISIETQKRQNFYTIAYTAKDPYVTKKVVETLLNIFVESALGDTRVESDTAQRFLEQQIREYESRLIEAENRLTGFKRKYIDTLPGQGGDVFARLQEVRATLQDLNLELKEAGIRRDELRRQYEAAERDERQRQAAEGRLAVVATPGEQRILAMEKRLDDLLLRYTEAHPDVREARQTIDELKKQEREIQESQAAGNSDVNVTSIAVEELKLAYRQSEVSLTGIRVRTNEYKKRIEVLREKLDTLPQVEAELKKLNRDYSINQETYGQLVQRLESARMSKQADEAGDNVKFRVIDPPKIPLVPTGPKRVIFSVVILVLALIAGGGLAFLIAQFKPVYYDTTLLRKGTEIPVLGQVSRVWTSSVAMKRRLEVSAFVTVGAMLVTVFGAILVIYSIGLRGEIIALINS
ncbi:MAG: chain length-determining protein [Gammaproteobacteria bacterium (ex Lamellibrachia satsuma)]|nr:MAG: chain length-determining protein [Gammaproteobacteria bacterium (ex Lamellibrachia satsuma)]RRS30471.1 MAG: chain length-determining protein [Gammaproteobacteria bacterium (ex Lamellibrachia satsuma)]RRS37303.1 MAG: chain length-determining protein [Gammaproteobacteria bacterium (ex Lamellibrachia satsuma)]